MSNFYENNTKEKLELRMLGRIPKGLDKRDGSLIQSVIGSIAHLLSGYYLDLDEAEANGFLMTASDEYLDMKVAERGISRKSANAAIRKGKFDVDVGIDTAFETISGENSLTFTTTEFIENSDGFYYYKMICSELGVVGNGYEGSLKAINNISGLKVAQLEDILISGQDAETDADLRERYIQSIREKPFGGNLSAYLTEIRAIEGVGAIQIWPFWNGGGTVLISLLDSAFNIASDELIEKVQNYICPAEADDATPSANGYGLAPIGANVTVVKPTKFNINISGEILISVDKDYETTINEIKRDIDSYLLSIRKKWDRRLSDKVIKYEISVIYQRISAIIMTVDGVLNLKGLLVNKAENDIILTQTSKVQNVPFLGTVDLISMDGNK